jgi:hypothetical protein
MTTRRRNRIRGFQRVLDSYRRDGISDDYLAGIVRALNGAPIGAMELDDIIAADLVAERLPADAEDPAALPAND